MLRSIILAAALVPWLAWHGNVHAETIQEAEQQLAEGNTGEAFARFEQLAIDGNPEAQERLARLYAGGVGIEKDLAQAAKWYRRAANNGLADAQFALGVLYSTGNGVERDDGLAVDWYVSAAKQGHIDAQYNLGYMYASGRGVDQDLGRARTWYKLAADQGHTRAQINLGAMYASGDGVPRDDTIAASWYRMAAQQGDADAQYSLGYLHEFGRGVANDRDQALRWYTAAAEQGHIEAGHRRAALEARLEASSRHVIVELANLRAGPGTDHEVIAQLPRDTAVIDLTSRGDWTQVSIPGRSPSRGWLHGSLLDSPDQATASPPSDAPAEPLAEAQRPVATDVPAVERPEDASADVDGVIVDAQGTQSEPSTPDSAERAQALAAQAESAKGELKQTLDEREALLERLSTITRQTAALSAQIEEMETRRTPTAGRVPPATRASPPPVDTKETVAETDVTASPAPTSSWMREGFAAMLDRLDRRLLDIETRLATLESNQAMIAGELRAARESRETVMRLAGEMDKKLVTQRLQTVEAQASEMGARLEMKKLQMQLNESQIRARDLERQLATRAADRDEQTQRMISLEEERDALMTGLDAAEKRLAHLRGQLEGDDPPRVETAPLESAAPAR